MILSGDSHERTYSPIIRNGVLVVEPGSFASFLGRLDVRIDTTGRPHYDWSLEELRADRVAEDPLERRIVDQSLAPYRARMQVTLGETDAPLERYGVVETSADDVLADAVREATGTEIALSNGFRFGHPIPAGPIHEADLWMLYPVTSRVKTGTVSGAQLRAFWESEIEHVFSTDPARLFGGWLPRVSGMSVRFRADAPMGQRVVSIAVGGQPLDPARRYTVAACEREGDDPNTLCRIHDVQDARVIDLDNHDVVRTYLSRHPRLSPGDQQRIEATDRPQRMYFAIHSLDQRRRASRRRGSDHRTPSRAYTARRPRRNCGRRSRHCCGARVAARMN